jgi:co-chaperonin GroES (HSP10)
MSLITYKTDGLKAVKNHVLVKGMEFAERITNGGIIVPTDDGKSSGIKPRWGEVVAVGPLQKDIKVGEWVLVGHGRWTRGMTINVAGEEMNLRRVDPDDILLIADEYHDNETWSSAVSGDDNSHRIEGSVHNHDGGGLTG